MHREVVDKDKNEMYMVLMNFGGRDENVDLTKVADGFGEQCKVHTAGADSSHRVG